MTGGVSEKGQGWLWAPICLSPLGVLVAGYLSVKRFTGGSLVCSRWAQCDVVNNSLYAKFYGVPVAFIGLAGYLVLLVLAIATLQSDGSVRRRLVGLSFLLSLGGLAFSAYLTYIELYVIQAVCSWCVSSVIIITLLTIVGTVNVWRTTPGRARASAAATAVRS
jgi:uncharacterized membrane protein